MLTSEHAVNGTLIANLTKGSTRKVQTVCDDCGKQSKTVWSNYVQGQRKRGWTRKTYCQLCIARHISKSAKGKPNPKVGTANALRRGSAHPSWKGGQYVDHHRYVMVSVRSGLVNFDRRTGVYKANVKLRELLGPPKSPSGHNVVGDDERDGLKTEGLGNQQPSRLRNERKVQRLDHGAPMPLKGNGQ